MQLPVDSVYFTADNVQICRGAVLRLHAVADLSAEHTDLHMEEEE